LLNQFIVTLGFRKNVYSVKISDSREALQISTAF